MSLGVKDQDYLDLENIIFPLAAIVMCINIVVSHVILQLHMYLTFALQKRT